MTAIGVFKAYQWPILIGDIAISGPKEAGQLTSLPTIGSTENVFKADAERVIVGAAQKAVICHENLSMAWTGSVLAASTLVADLRAIHFLSEKSIIECFRDQSPSRATDDLRFAGFWLDSPQNSVRFFSGSGRTVEFGAGSFFGGTGAMWLRDAVKRVLARSKPEDVRPLTSKSANFAARLAIQAIGSLMAEECLDRRSLTNYFGGGYEIITLSAGRFQKVDFASYVLQLIEPNGTISPKQVMRPLYHNGNLYFRSANFKGQEMIHIIAPPDAQVKPAGEQSATLQSLGDFDADCVSTLTFGERQGKVWAHSRFDTDGNTRVLRDAQGKLHINTTPSVHSELLSTMPPASAETERPKTVEDIELLAEQAGDAASRGDHARAATLWQEVLAERIRAIGEEHIDTIAAMFQLNAARHALGDLLNAREGYEVILAMLHERAEDDSDRLAVKASLALVLSEDGDPDGARKELKEVLSIRKRTQGEDHPSLWPTRMNLAGLQVSAGRLSEAAEEQEAVLEQRRLQLGEDHLDTLTTRERLATTRYLQADFLSAVQHQEIAVLGLRKNLDSKAPILIAATKAFGQFLEALGNHAVDLSTRGDWVTARAWQDAILERMIDIYGEDHLATMRTRHNLAGTLFRQGKVDEARAMLMELLVRQSDVLGVAHEETQRTQKNLQLM